MAEIRAQALALLNEVKMQDDAGAKADCLKRMMELVLEQDPSLLLPEFVPCLLEFQADAGSAVRENVAEMIGGICLQHTDYVQVMAPALIALLQDSAPGVVQRAITSGSNIFQTVFEQVALQGIDNGRVEEDLLECWNWMTRFKEAVYSLAFQPGDDDVQLLALKFVETTLLLFTPNSKSSLPDQQTTDGTSEGFQHLMTRIAGGHPVLDANTLEQEAYKNLGLLLDQLQSTEMPSLSGLVAFAIIDSLTGITERRPYMSETILPVLSALVPKSEHVLGSSSDNIIHELKGLSLTALTSKQPGDLPWREQLVASLRSVNVEEAGDQVIKEPGTPTSVSSVSEFKESGTPTSTSSVSETKITRPSITPRTGLKPRNTSATASTATAIPRTASPLRQIRTSSAATSTTAPPRTASPARQARTSFAATSGTAAPRAAPPTSATASSRTAPPSPSATAPSRTAPPSSATALPRTASPARQTRTSSAATSTIAPPRTASPARTAMSSSAAGSVSAPPRTASPARHARSSSAATVENAPPRTASPARQTKTSVSTTVTGPPRTASPSRQPRTSSTATTATTAMRPASPLVKPAKTTGPVSRNGPASGKAIRGSSPARPRSGPVDNTVSRVPSSPRAGSSVENPKASSVIVPFPPTTAKSSVRPSLTSLKVSPRPSPSSSPRAAPSLENPRASGVIVPFPLTTVKSLPKPSATPVKLSPRPASPSVKTAPRSASPSVKSSARPASPSVKPAPRAASPSARATIGSSPRTASGNVASRPASPSQAARKSLAASPNQLPSPSPRASEIKPTQIPTPNGSSTGISISSRPGASNNKPSVSTNVTVPSASPATSARSKVSPSAPSQSLLKSKFGVLTPSARKGPQLPACESPQSLSSGRSDPSLDVPSDSVDATAARGMMQEAPTQRLRIASFKRNSSGLSKGTEIVSPEVLPAQPMTLNTKKRCGWITSQSDEAHIAYHDSEWGIPVYDDKLLFELIVLQGAQAELSWPTILARRNNFRAVFANFDPAIVAKFDEKKKLSLIADSSICFPEAKVRGAVDNAALVLKIVEEYGSLSKFLWSYVNHKPIVSQYKLAKQVPVKTPKSEALSKELLRRGFRFVGPTTMYSVMQAAGLVCDHLVTCYKYQESSAENSPVTDSPLEGDKSVDSWQRISLPEWKTSNIIEPRLGAVDVYPHEFRRASANASDPVWAELPKIEEAREEELEKQEDEEAYDDISSSPKCEIPAC
ncbi:hypothetical protein KC19_4G140500 [Ceratodon purpureus]|uniref:Symplekin/Pta1 N-terminal domain-containing protein n=1 Tax=Ceratodon purpureus TaxID=3225 RepID=A0A8T0IAJ8_CERPU|nr:hypothetical protein KC19_4G140500 [Ceratodon purpureus]KAG0579988.1 hypothetical protein KC19_4G140500 [Ceratodon purpureus]KAG0579989.1 hypothetical protein KC19_4G140500 [Ceratodon purpureus]